jgi:hypothetical protein
MADSICAYTSMLAPTNPNTSNSIPMVVMPAPINTTEPPVRLCDIYNTSSHKRWAVDTNLYRDAPTSKTVSGRPTPSTLAQILWLSHKGPNVLKKSVLGRCGLKNASKLFSKGRPNTYSLSELICCRGREGLRHRGNPERSQPCSACWMSCNASFTTLWRWS